jgi:hypothetical protein
MKAIKQSLNTPIGPALFWVVRILFRVTLTAALLCVAAFCAFGFLASFEPGNSIVWHFIYGGCGIGSLVMAACLWLPRKV